MNTALQDSKSQGTPYGLDSSSRLRWLSEHHRLFPLIACLLLMIIWASTFYVIGIERKAAKEATASESEALAETYEAQIVRALSEIDRTLKFVQYDYERHLDPNVLVNLRHRDLLPPSLVFVVRIVDRDGRVVASTRDDGAEIFTGQDIFESRRIGDSLSVGRPIVGDEEHRLRFSRRVSTMTGEFAGIVMVEVDAAYFVSGYDDAKLGNQGLLAIIGIDGIFRVRRSGDMIGSGAQVDYDSVVKPSSRIGESVLQIDPWDGIPRYVSVRQLFEFPLAVIVGLSEQERLASVTKHQWIYVGRAAIATLMTVLLIGTLGWLSWQLSQSRARAVEERMKYAEQVEHLAYHDSLTALPNRSMCGRLLVQSIGRAKRHDKQLAVLFIDLDGFKPINDLLGHDAGDRLLKEVGHRLTHCVRESDLVARLGGDEFVIVLPDLDDAQPAESVAQKVISAIGSPFVVMGHEFRITASVGISLYPRDGEDEQTLMKTADMAMYHAKERGKNNFQFYSRKLIEQSLRRALRRKASSHRTIRGSAVRARGG